jgi:hypothetical protein
MKLRQDKTDLRRVRAAEGASDCLHSRGDRTTRETNRRMEDAIDAMLPPDYHLDESDPDIITLRRKDGTFVAAFSAQGATREGIIEAAVQDSKGEDS